MDLFPLQMLQNDSDYKVTIAAVSPGSKLSTPTSANHDEVPVSTSSAHAPNAGDVYRCTFPHCHKAFKELRLLKAHMTVHTGTSYYFCFRIWYLIRMHSIKSNV